MFISLLPLNPLSTLLTPFSPSRAAFPTSYQLTKKTTLERPGDSPLTREGAVKKREIKPKVRNNPFILPIIAQHDLLFLLFRKTLRVEFRQDAAEKLPDLHLGDILDPIAPVVPLGYHAKGESVPLRKALSIDPIG